VEGVITMELNKIPPHDEEAEQAVLGSMLTDKDAVISAIEVLKKEDFYREDNKAILCGDCYCTSNFVREKIDSIKLLEQQLTEKDAEIERMKELDKATSESLYASRELYEKEKTKRWALEKQLKTNTHQVCEKIYKEFEQHEFGGKYANSYDGSSQLDLDVIKQFLDQLENNAEGENENQL